MRLNIMKIGLLALGIATLSACSTAPTPPPQPDMSHLVPANRDMPPQLIGQTGVTLPDYSEHQDTDTKTKDEGEKYVR